MRNEDQAMNDMNNNSENIDKDTLISLVVDEQASDADWVQLRTLGEKDASVWRDLAEAQHEHAELCRALESAIAVADGVEAPVEHYIETRFTNRLRVVATWGGWAVAAVLVLAFIKNPGLAGPATQGNQANLAGPLLGDVTPDEALQRYIDEGRRTGQVLEEIPERVLVDTRSLGEGLGVEVIFIRQIKERVHVQTLYRPGQDEFGRHISMPIKFKPKPSDPI